MQNRETERMVSPNMRISKIAGRTGCDRGLGELPLAANAAARTPIDAASRVRARELEQESEQEEGASEQPGTSARRVRLLTFYYHSSRTPVHMNFGPVSNELWTAKTCDTAMQAKPFCASVFRWDWAHLTSTPTHRQARGFGQILSTDSCAVFGRANVRRTRFV